MEIFRNRIVESDTVVVDAIFIPGPFEAAAWRFQNLERIGVRSFDQLGFHENVGSVFGVSLIDVRQGDGVGIDYLLSVIIGMILICDITAKIVQNLESGGR